MMNESTDQLGLPKEIQFRPREAQEIEIGEVWERRQPVVIWDDCRLWVASRFRGRRTLTEAGEGGSEAISFRVLEKL